MFLDTKGSPSNRAPDSPPIWVLPPALQQLNDCGEHELVEELITIFESDTEARLQVLRDAVATGKYAIVKAEAHTIKGAASQVGALRVAEACRRLELEALQAAPADLGTGLARVTASFQEVCGFFAARRSATGSAI